MPGLLKKQPRFSMLNKAINGVFNNPVTRFLGNKAVNAVRAGANRLGLAMPSVVVPPAAAPAVNPAGHRAAPAAPQPAPRLPQAQSNNPADIMGDFFERMKNALKNNLQDEFNQNANRRNRAEDEMNPERSKSLLPTFSRALTKLMPTFMDGIFDVFASLINALLSLFKVKQETKDLVTGIVKPLGKAMVSGNPGEGLANMATTVAPLLVEGLTKFLGVNIPASVARDAAAFPQRQQANNGYMPSASSIFSQIAPSPATAANPGVPMSLRRKNVLGRRGSATNHY